MRTLLDIIASIGLWRSKQSKTSGLVFRLITKYTTTLQFISIVVILSNVLFGDAIKCFSGDAFSKWDRTMDMKCWMDGVYVLKELLNVKHGKAIHYGVGMASENSEKIYQRYYQWIVPLLCINAFVFYLPRIIWKAFEKGIMDKMLNCAYYPVMQKDWDDRKQQIISYVKDVKKKYHHQYALQYLMCEILAVLSVLLNIFTLHVFINDFWNGYLGAVFAVLKGDFELFSQIAAQYFPLEAKCDLQIYGASGTIEHRDSICILPQNIVNEKLFVVLYVWYIFILICAIFNMIYLFIMYSIKILRIYDIGHMLERECTIRSCKEISDNGDYGLWFTLRTIRLNLTPTHFQDFCKDLKIALKSKAPVIHYDNNDDEDIEKY